MVTKKKREDFSILLWRTEKQSISQNYQETYSAVHNKPFYVVDLSENKKKAAVEGGKPLNSGEIQTED